PRTETESRIFRSGINVLIREKDQDRGARMDQQVLEVDERQRQQEQRRQEQHRQTRKKGYLLAAVLGFIFLIIAVVGISMRVSERRALAKETEEIAVPTVEVIHPSTEPPQSEIQLPSTLQAYIEAPIYARTTGYLRRWYKDIGSKVNRGELLADIETPEVDQELLQSTSGVSMSARSSPRFKIGRAH